MDTISEQKYRQLKGDVEQAKSEADKARGALDQLLTRLEEEYGCKNLAQARTKLAELESEKNKAQKEFAKALQDYEKEWKRD